MKIFHRIDDIEEYNEKYVDIFKFFEENTNEFIIAAIPERLSNRYRDLLSSFNHCVVYQHGYAHHNRVLKGWYDEFPDTMEFDEKYNLLKSGKERLESILNRKVFGYVPPWNNTGDETIIILKKLGFQIYSAQTNNTKSFINNKDICVDVIERYTPEIKYRNLEDVYNEICTMKEQDKCIGIMYHFNDPSEKELSEICRFVKRVELLNG